MQFLKLTCGLSYRKLGKVTDENWKQIMEWLNRVRKNEKQTKNPNIFLQILGFFIVLL
jgi:hypothetical protein